MNGTVAAEASGALPGHRQSLAGSVPFRALRQPPSALTRTEFAQALREGTPQAKACRGNKLPRPRREEASLTGLGGRRREVPWGGQLRGLYFTLWTTAQALHWRRKRGIPSGEGREGEAFLGSSCSWILGRAKAEAGSGRCPQSSEHQEPGPASTARAARTVDQGP